MELCTCSVVCCVCFFGKRSCSTCAQPKWSLNLLVSTTQSTQSRFMFNPQEKSLKIAAWVCLIKHSPLCSLVHWSFHSFPICAFSIPGIATSSSCCRPARGHGHLPGMALASPGCCANRGMLLVSAPRVKPISVHPKVPAGAAKRCTECAIPWNTLQQTRQHYNVYARRKPTKCQNHKQNRMSGPLR